MSAKNVANEDCVMECEGLKSAGGEVVDGLFWFFLLIMVQCSYT